MSTIENNRRRIKRMDTWISHAEAASGDDDSHLRFLFYWIAYEAAYQTYETGKAEDRRKRLHKKLARHDRGKLQASCANSGTTSCAFSSCGRRIRLSGARA